MHMAIEYVTLLGNESGFANQISQHFFISSIVGTRRGYNVLLNHDRAHVIGAKAKGHLTKFQTLRQPGRLKIFNVIQKQPRHGQHHEIVDPGWFIFNAAAERRVLSLEGPGYECSEASGFVLQVPDSLQVTHAMLDIIAYA